MKTYQPKKQEVKRRWWLIDGQNMVLGRLASRAAVLLMGKHKAIFSPHVDTGDNVIVINASGVRLTGKKLDQKMDYRHSGYPGGQKFTSYRTLMAEKPDRAVELAVRGMLPHTNLGDRMFKKLHVYRGASYPQIPQKPEVIK